MLNYLILKIDDLFKLCDYDDINYNDSIIVTCAEGTAVAPSGILELKFGKREFVEQLSSIGYQHLS